MAVGSIRIRMALLYSSILLLTLLTVEVITYLVVSNTLRESIDETLRSEARWLSSVFQSPPTNPQETERIEDVVTSHTLLVPLQLFIEVRGKRGDLLYKSPNLGADPLAFNEPMGEEIEIHALKSAAGMPIIAAVTKTPGALICVASSAERYAAPVRVLFFIFLLLTPAVLLFSAVGGYAVAKVSLRPIDAIARAARRITVENLNERIPEPTTKDEIGRLSATFNEMLGRLHTAVNQAKEFPANVAHELRNSLALIRSSLDEALVSDLTVDQVRKMAASSLDEVNRMANMVESLFVLSITDIDKIRREFKEIQFDEVVAGLHWESLILAQTKKIQVTLTRLDSAKICGDEKLIRQLFLNLLDNAIKYNHEGGTIHLSLVRQNSEVELRIADSGIGIGEEEREKIFERFYRTEGARKVDAEGVGLGLAIVKWIVEVHRGRVGVESTPGLGTTFTISFPILASAKENRGSPPRR